MCNSVLDVNDNDPEFIPDSDYDVSFTENTDIIEFSVEATDIDIGTNSEITYEIINGSINNAFVIGKFIHKSWIFYITCLLFRSRQWYDD